MIGYVRQYNCLPGRMFLYNFVSDRYKDVFVSADLTPEERVERRRLVSELKERRAADPGKTFFIKGGKIIMSDT